MFCTQCGHKNGADANFCSSCGAPLAQKVHEDITMSIPVAEVAEVEEELGVNIEAPLPGSAVLIVRRSGGLDAGDRYELNKPVTTAGRSADADILLDDITVSRKHAEFSRSDSEVTLRDVGSLNGTYVNRDLVEQAVLRTGDEVQIGKFKLLYLANLG
jgi:FHA domain/zinc-ribbon domain